MATGFDSYDPAGPRLSRPVSEQSMERFSAEVRRLSRQSQVTSDGDGVASLAEIAPGMRVDLLVEELNVAEEELRTQFDELVVSRTQLELERAKYSELFDLAPDAYLVTDMNGAVIESNRMAQAMFDRGTQQLRQTALISFVVSPSRREFRAMLQEVTQGGRQRVEMAVRSRTPAIVDVEATVAPVLDSKGTAVGLRWILRDVTEQRAIQRDNAKLRADLEQTVVERTRELTEAVSALRNQHDVASQSSRQKSEFLAFLSHEVRTPMQALMGYTDVLMIGVHGPVTDLQRQDLERMQRVQQHILHLLNQLLDFSRIESGNEKFRSESVDLSTLCERSIELVRPQATAAGVAIKCVGEANISARADTNSVRQILVNLLGNAIKFGGGRDEIVVTTTRDERDDGFVMISVHDSGDGIPASSREAIFEPYVHLNSTMQGTGLGLPISRRLALSMAGDLYLSPSEKGALFVLRLPAE